MKQKSSVWVFVGYSLMMVSMLVMMLTFYYAYFFNDMVFSVTINSFGEAHLEAVLICIMLVFGLFGFYSSYCMLMKVENNE